VNEFITACRKEWKRLGVPDLVADEMAADLDVDLGEARAEGFSIVAVLGPAAIDPRSFAAEWASARGIVPAADAQETRLEKLRRFPSRAGLRLPLIASGVAVVIGALIATQRPTWRQFLGLPHLRFMGSPSYGSGGFSTGPPVDVPLIKLATLVLLLGAIGLTASSAYWLWTRARRPTPA